VCMHVWCVYVMRVHVRVSVYVTCFMFVALAFLVAPYIFLFFLFFLLPLTYDIRT
jgi:hypothetical protein